MKLGCGIAQPLTFGIRYPCGFLWSRNTEASLLLLHEIFSSSTISNGCCKETAVAHIYILSTYEDILASPAVLERAQRLFASLKDGDTWDQRV